MTPRELMLYVDGYNEQFKREREAIIVQAYLTAQFYRVKKLPSLKKVLDNIREKPKTKEQTPEEMLEFAKRFQARLERER